MITTMLQGGLGNQMFQYAMGLAQATRLGVELQLDTTYLQNDKMRQYNLGLYGNITEKIVTGSVPTVNEDGLPFKQYDIKDGDVLKGYWQSEKYFENIWYLIADKFNMAKPVSELYYTGLVKRISDAGPLSTFVTIRRTDYVQKQDFHGVLPREYYLKAILDIRHHLQKDPVLFVFSDEPDWCKQNLDLVLPFEVCGTYDRTTATHLGSEDLDLYLMSLCRNAIMANSSFSWWGAWLGDGFGFRWGRNVIAPKQWFTTDKVDSKDIVPERWRLI
jgi:hypothetical protein